MKFINKSVLAVFTALACAGQALAYPGEVTKLTKGEGKNQITIYNFKDLHLPGQHDEKNEQIIRKLAYTLNATVLLESYLLYQGTDEILKTALETTKKDLKVRLLYKQGKKDEAIKKFRKFHPDLAQNKVQKYCEFLTFLDLLGINPPSSTINVETRFYLTIKPPLTKDLAEDIFSEMDNFKKKQLQEIEKTLEMIKKKTKAETDQTVKAFYTKTLEESKNQIDFIKTNDGHQAPEVLYEELTKATYGFTDMTIILELLNGIQAGQKNFIICSGGLHGDAIEKLLSDDKENYGFTKEVLLKREVIKNKLSEANLETMNEFKSLLLDVILPQTNKQPCDVGSNNTQDSKPTPIFTPKRLLMTTGIIAATTLAILYGPTLWKWMKTKFA